jgi:hypothetical protein
MFGKYVLRYALLILMVIVMTTLLAPYIGQLGTFVVSILLGYNFTTIVDWMGLGKWLN